MFDEFARCVFDDDGGGDADDDIRFSVRFSVRFSDDEVSDLVLFRRVTCLVISATSAVSILANTVPLFVHKIVVGTTLTPYLSTNDGVVSAGIDLNSIKGQTLTRALNTAES